MMYKWILGLLLFVQILTGTVRGHSERYGRLLLQQQSDAQGTLNATFQTTLPQADCTQFLAFDNISQFLNEWNAIFSCEGCTFVAGFFCENFPVFNVTVELPSNGVTTDFFQSVINTAVLQPSCILDQNVSSYIGASVTVLSASQQLSIPSSTDTGLNLIEGCILPPPPPPSTVDDGALDLRFDFVFTAQNSPPPPLPNLLSQADVSQQPDLEDGKISDQQDIAPVSDEELVDNISTTPVQLAIDFDDQDNTEENVGEIPQVEGQQIITQQNMEIIQSDEQQIQPQFPPITETPTSTDDLDTLEDVDDTVVLKVLGAEPIVESQQEVDQEIILTEIYFPPSTEVTQNRVDNLEEVDSIKDDEPVVELQSLQVTQYLQESDIELALTPTIDGIGSLDEVDDFPVLNAIDIEVQQQSQIPQMEEEDQKESDIEEAQTPMIDDVSQLEEVDDMAISSLRDPKPIFESQQLQTLPQTEADLDENELGEVAPEIEMTPVPVFSTVMEKYFEELEPEPEQIVTQESNEVDLKESQGDVEAPVQENGSGFFPILQEDLVYVDTFPFGEQLPEQDVERLVPPATEEAAAVISSARISEELTADNLQSLFAILLGVQNG